MVNMLSISASEGTSRYPSVLRNQFALTMKITLFIVLAFFLFPPAVETLAQEHDEVILSADSLRNENRTIQLDDGWKYHPGDNAAWAKPDFDDSSWEIADTQLLPKELPATTTMTATFLLIPCSIPSQAPKAAWLSLKGRLFPPEPSYLVTAITWRC